MSELAITKEHALQLGQSLLGSKSFGPLTISYDIDLSIPQVTANAELYGVSIGSIVINSENPTETISGSVGVSEAELSLAVDFVQKKLDYDVDIGASGHTVYKGSGILFSW